MIIENLDGLSLNSSVTRVCDECGQKSITKKSIILCGRKKRNNEKDYCKSCSYKFRVCPKFFGEDNVHWKGGRWITENGYYRLTSGKYEHKEIMSKYLGRELIREEKIHHIDLDKKNNDISNMFLCKNKTEHWACHQMMEKCGFELFNINIWFDRNLKIYVKQKIKDNYKVECDIEDILKIKTYKEKRRQTSGYYLVPTNRRLKLKQIHIMIIERIIARKLFANETTHHINGNTLDNRPENLCLMTRSEHKLCHYSLQNCIAEFYKQGLVGFENGIYFVRET